MQINGGKMQGAQEVMLSANEELGKFPFHEFERFKDDPNTGPPRPRIGDTLSIHLSQDARSSAIWNLTVFVQVAQGWFILGPDIVTNPPNPAQGQGDPPARTVGFASCPGTIGWKVLCRSDDPEEIADLVIQSREGGNANAFGVVPVVFIPPG
jgi:hypothetical protein